MPFNQILVGRLNRYVQKLLQIKNTALLDLSPSLQPVLELETGVEDRYLQGWVRFAVTTTVNAVAAQTASMQLRNPAGSNVIAVMEKINVLPGATSLCRWEVFPQSADFSTPVSTNSSRLDARAQPGATLQVSQGTRTNFPGNTAVFRELATTTLSETPFIVTTNQEITVLPGDAISLDLELVNTQCSFAAMWRERVLESSELT